MMPDAVPTAAPSSTRITRTVTVTHRWVGLTFGWLILLTALTGATLAFRPQLERAVYPGMMTVRPCADPRPIDALVDAARAARGGVAALYIRGFGQSDAAYRVRFANNETVYVDPCTTQVVGDQNRYAGLFGTLELLHTLHFSPLGSALVGYDALIFAILIVGGGLVLLWPIVRRNPRRALTLDRRLEGRAWNLSVHRTVALIVSPVLLAIALTGAPQALGWLEKGLYTLTGTEMTEPPLAQAGARRVSLEAAYSAARRLAPFAQEILVHIPAKPREAFEIYMIAADAPHANARSYLYLDPVTGEVLRYIPYARSSLGSKIFYWAVSLHSGAVGGPIGRLILLAAAAAVVLLAYTGMRSYLRGRARVRTRAELSVHPTLAVSVVGIADETENVRVFDLADVNGNALPDVTPGAHIDVHLAHGAIRQYSLINGSNEGNVYRIAVRRAPDSRGGSAEMHDDVAIGDLLTVGAPRNHFPIVGGAAHHHLIAGGIGITPLLSMARHLLAGGSEFTLDYFTRSRASTPFHSLLTSPAFAGRVRFHHGVAIDAISHHARALLTPCRPGTHLYVCGGSAFITAIEAAAAAEDWPAATIHHEHFAADPSLWAAPRHPFDVVLARSQRTVAVAADRTIVEALAEHGLPTTTSCAQGICGSCLTRVIDGVPDHRDAVLSPEQRASGNLMLICVSRASRDRLVLDL